MNSDQEDTAKKPVSKFIIITIPRSGDGPRDLLRMRKVHGLLVDNPGKDKFFFEIPNDKEDDITQIEFPNQTTTIDDELLEKLNKIISNENIAVIQ